MIDRRKWWSWAGWELFSTYRPVPKIHYDASVMETLVPDRVRVTPQGCVLAFVEHPYDLLLDIPRVIK